MALAAAFLGATFLARVDCAWAEPRPGQTLAAFGDAVRDRLAEQGDLMGYALQPCRLTPAFGRAGETYVGRAFSQRPDAAIVLVAVEAGQVVRWQEFDLPGLQGWITHGRIRCRGGTLDVVHGRTVQRYRWDRGVFRRKG